MPETKTEAERNFFGPRFEIGQVVEYRGEKDSPDTVELFKESYGLELGNKYVVKDQKINVIPGTLSPGGPQADESYQEISLKGVKEGKPTARPLFFPSTWFIPVMEEHTKEPK